MKVLVSVHVPAISEKYDVLLPSAMRIKHLSALIAGAVEEISNHRYITSGEEYLCSQEQNILLNENATLEMYGIRNGDHLVII